MVRRAFKANNPDSRSGVYRWALAGALWGLLSFLFDYVMAITRLVCGFSARWPLVWDALWWVLPSRWAVRLNEALDPHGRYRILFLGDTMVVWIAASVLLGAAAGLGAWLLMHWIRRIASRRQS